MEPASLNRRSTSEYIREECAPVPITILSDSDVREVLDTLTKQDVLDIHRALADALHSYSTTTDPGESGCCSANQPSRIQVKGKEGGTTLFMPATSDVGFGVKIVTLGESAADRTMPHDMNSLNLSDTSSTTNSSNPSNFSRSSGSSKSLDKLSSTASSTRSKPLTDIKTEPDHPGIINPGVTITPAMSTSARGSVTLLTPTGQMRALINASTLTAFRTALVSCMIFKNRHSVHTLTVFGAGLQAYWHIFLAFLLRPGEIHHLHVINRDFTRAQRLIMSLGQSENDGVANEISSDKLRPSILTPEYGEYTRLLKENVRAADVIFCCTPATAPLFPASHLTSSEGRRKARYVAAIGSYKPHMQELHEDILRQAVRGPSANDHHHKGLHMHQRHANEGGAVIVDTIEGAMKEAGDVIKAGIGGSGIVELGELVMLKRSHWKEKAEREEHERNNAAHDGQSKSHGLGHLFRHQKDDRSNEGDGGLRDWLERGNVIYKGVGIGLMDVVVGMEIVRLAEERGIGTKVKNF